MKASENLSKELRIMSNYTAKEGPMSSTLMMMHTKPTYLRKKNVEKTTDTVTRAEIILTAQKNSDLRENLLVAMVLKGLCKVSNDLNYT